MIVKAVVKATIEIELGDGWAKEAPASQVFEQASSSAVAQLERMFEAGARGVRQSLHGRVVDAKTTMVLAKEKP